MRFRPLVVVSFFVAAPWVATLACGPRDTQPVAPIMVAEPPTRASSVASASSSAPERPTTAAADSNAEDAAESERELTPEEYRRKALAEAEQFGRISSYNPDAGDSRGLEALAPGLGTGTHGKGFVGSPTLRQGATQVNGRLPPEVIQRIIRQNLHRRGFRGRRRAPGVQRPGGPRPRRPYSKRAETTRAPRVISGARSVSHAVRMATARGSTSSLPAKPEVVVQRIALVASLEEVVALRAGAPCRGSGALFACFSASAARF